MDKGKKDFDFGRNDSMNRTNHPRKKQFRELLILVAFSADGFFGHGQVVVHGRPSLFHITF